MLKKEEILKKLTECIVDFNIEGIRGAAQEAMQENIPVHEAIMDGMSKGMKIVGDKFEAGEYFLSDLLMAGETMKAAMEVLDPYLKASPLQSIGTVVIGTVKGDIHDIGKNIVATLLQSAGFKVCDLGTDVDSSRFIDTAQKEDADLVALSALLTVTMNHMKEVVDELKKTGLKDKVKVIVGGAPITERFAKQIGADAYAEDAVSGVEMCKKILGKP